MTARRWRNGRQAREATSAGALKVLADRGYFSGSEVLACTEAGILAVCPKPLTLNAKAESRFGKQDFVYQAESDTYRCSAGETMTRRGWNIARHDSSRLCDAHLWLALRGEGELHCQHQAAHQALGAARQQR